MGTVRSTTLGCQLRGLSENLVLHLEPLPYVLSAVCLMCVLVISQWLLSLLFAHTARLLLLVLLAELQLRLDLPAANGFHLTADKSSF